jgi:predicted TIM-barrel fold metal-dependent hydrolase
MDANGIGRAVCFPFTLASAYALDEFVTDGRVELSAGRVPFDRENDILANEVERIDCPNKRLLQFGMFDPSREAAGQVKCLEPLVGKLAGLKTQSTVIQSPIRDLIREGRPIMELARRHRLPVLFHTSIHPSDVWANAGDCLDVAEAYPDVRFNLAHSLRFHLPSLKRAAQLPNVWIDCSAHLIHCQLAREDSPVVAKRAERLDADYAKPADVLQAAAAVLGEGKYLWGSDNPYMSWCAGNLSAVFTYKAEADVLHALPAALKHSMAHAAPEAWLFGAAPA